MLETSPKFNLTDCWKQSIILMSLQMYEKKVECVLLPKAMAKKNVTSDENWILSDRIWAEFRARNYFLATESESGREE